MLSCAVGLLIVLLDTHNAPGARPIADAPDTSPRPAIDIPAPVFWDHERNRRVGASAHRFELDDTSQNRAISAWYHLAYVVGSDRVRFFEHNAPTTRQHASRIVTAQDLAWQVATTLTGEPRSVSAPSHTLPEWARPRSGTLDGRSGGLLFALAYIDLLTPGLLAGDLRVAASGALYSNGAISQVLHVDAKLAAARLAGVDVVFAPDFPFGNGTVTVVQDHRGPPEPDRAIGTWLNTAGYEAAGRRAGANPHSTALVAIDDVRQAIAWLCGRTQRPDTCAIARDTATTPFATSRTWTHDPGEAARGGITEGRVDLSPIMS